jgi:hypothetical protein
MGAMTPIGDQDRDGTSAAALRREGVGEGAGQPLLVLVG